METFEWVPLANPQARYQHNTFRARFGNGYIQAAGSGINSRYDEWPLTFQGSRDMIEDIQDFLDRHQGFRPFRWFPPLGTGAGLYDADEYSISVGPGGCANYTLNVTFRLRMRMYAPTNSAPPVVSGLHQIGQVIAVSQGSWESENPMQFEYQWLRNGEPIAGATGQNYTLVDDDLFDMISVRVTASSLGGSTSVETDPVLARLDSVVSWLYSDIDDTVFVDPAGIVPAIIGDPVGRINDSSGNGNDFTQPTVTARPILRGSETGIAYLDFDGTDDLISTELPAIENGTVVIAGTGGIWIDDDYNFDGGTFSIGPTSYTNGPEGILTAIGEPIVGGFLVINRQLSQRERELVVEELKDRGAPGVFGLASNVFSIDNATNVGAGIVVDTTEAFFAREPMDLSSTIDFSDGRVSDEFGWSTGDYILVELDVSQFSPGQLQVAHSVTGCFGEDPNRFYRAPGFSRRVLRVSPSAAALRFGYSANHQAKVSSVSLRKLELIP